MDDYSKLKKRCLLVLAKIQGYDVQKQIDIIEEELFSISKPENYSGSNGLEVSHIKGFNETCVVLQQYVPRDPKTMTVVEYFQTLDIIREQLKAKKRSNKRKK